MKILIDIDFAKTYSFVDCKEMIREGMQLSDAHLSALITVNQEYCNQICLNDPKDCSKVKICAVRDNLKLFKGLR